MFEFDFFDAHSKRIMQRVMQNNGGKYIQREMRKAFKSAGTVIVSRVQRAIFNPPKTGRLYILPKKLAVRAGKMYHTASAPGQAPANLTGRLARGTNSKVRGNDLEFGYSEKTPYGKFLEGGTKKMEPRPNIEKQGNRGSSVLEEFSYTHLHQAMDAWLG